jgi:predicted nucleic acid-binding protein
MTTVVVDAGVLIGALDSTDAHHALAVRALAEIGRDDTLVVPASVLAEILVRPYAAGGAAVRDIERFLAALSAQVHPVDVSIARAAARLRATHRSVRLPDALLLGTAAVLSATVLTTDLRWPRELDIPVRVPA